MKKLIILSMMFVLPLSVFAQSKKTQDSTTEVKIKKITEEATAAASEAADAAKKTVKEAEQALDTTAYHRAQRRHSLVASYSPLETWIPSKYGITYGYSPTAESTWEIDYIRGSISVPFIIDDLGSIVEQRLSINKRSYSSRNSFNFIYGINYTSLTVELGSSYLAAITSGDVGLYDLVEISSLGVNWGMGNRWQLSNKMILGIDWFEVHVPVHVLESDADFLTANADADKKDDVRDVVDVIEHMPTFATFKLQIGLSF